MMYSIDTQNLFEMQSNWLRKSITGPANELSASAMLKANKVYFRQSNALKLVSMCKDYNLRSIYHGQI